MLPAAEGSMTATVRGIAPDMTIADDFDETRAPSGSGVPRRPLKRIKVRELLENEREAILEHAGQDYRLRVTANGKLILTK
jgi:hemin uptake protein HemP